MTNLMEIGELAKEYKNIFQSGQTSFYDICTLGRKLFDYGFYDESNKCFKIAVNGMLQMIDHDRIDQALMAENLIYASFVKTKEQEEHYAQCFNIWSDHFKKYARTLNLPKLKPVENDNTIVFLVQNGVLLGHTGVMFKVIDEWMKLKNKNLKIYVAVLSGVKENFKSEIDKREIALIQNKSIDCNHRDKNIIWLRQEFERLGIYRLIWVSVPTWASYALALPLAKKQYFWSLKFHPVFIDPEVEKHICGGHRNEITRKYNEKNWTVCPFPLTVNITENSQVEVDKVKSKFDEDVVLLGTLAREEKFNSLEFLTCLGLILAQNVQCQYVFTGRKILPKMKEMMLSFGVWDRCHFVGWVDTNLYSEVIDIFLETFPFGCGVTSFQSMGHGTPILSYQAPDTMFGYQLAGGLGSNFKWGALSSEEAEALPILTGINSNHYVSLANKLINDIDYRDQISRKEKDYFENECLSASEYCKRLLEIII